MKIELMKRNDGVLIPASSFDQDKLNTMGVGEVWEFVYKKPRSLAHHRKFFALVDLVHQNLPENLDSRYPSTEHLRAEITMKAGYFTSWVTMKGETMYLPKSISFEAMDQGEFSEFYERCLDVVAKYYLPIGRDMLESEVMEFM